MGTSSPIPRMAQRVRSWAHLATDRASDHGADTERWHSIATRLYHAGDAYDGGRDDQAATIVDGVVGDLIRNDGESVACPSWCTLGDEHDGQEPAERRLHTGAVLALDVATATSDAEPTHVDVDAATQHGTAEAPFVRLTAGDDISGSAALTPRQARRVADALTTAAWLLDGPRS